MPLETFDSPTKTKEAQFHAARHEAYSSMSQEKQLNRSRTSGYELPHVSIEGIPQSDRSYEPAAERATVPESAIPKAVESYSPNGDKVTTYTYPDGSKQIYTEHRDGHTSEETRRSDGSWVRRSNYKEGLYTEIVEDSDGNITVTNIFGQTIKLKRDQSFTLPMG